MNIIVQIVQSVEKNLARGKLTAAEQENLKKECEQTKKLFIRGKLK